MTIGGTMNTELAKALSQDSNVSAETRAAALAVVAENESLAESFTMHARQGA